MIIKTLTVCLLLASVGACTARSSKIPAVNMRFYEASAGALNERVGGEFPLTVSLLSGVKLKFSKAAELLKVAQEDPRRLMRAGRSLEISNNTVLLGTVRSQELSSGSAAGVAVYQIAFTCDASDLESPGDLKNCAGYVMRVTRTWPGEIYEVTNPTISVIPEGGTAIGNLNGASDTSSQYTVKLSGEFVASLAQLGTGAQPENWSLPPMPPAETAPATKVPVPTPAAQ